MKLITVKIETNGELTHLTVDGVDMSHALAVTYHHEGGDVPKLTVILPVEKLSTTGKANAEKVSGHTDRHGRTNGQVPNLVRGKELVQG